MRERGILMSGPMVRAILAGKKTQTRRAVKPQPQFGMEWAARGFNPPCALHLDKYGTPIGTHTCPYGAPGDRLWVREAWNTTSPTSDETLPADVLGPEAPYFSSANGKRFKKRAVYQSTSPEMHPKYGISRWCPSIHMPRWASRITLAVESIRVERAQDISDADIAAEGVDAEAVEALWDAATTKRKIECGPVGSLMSGGDDVDAHDMEPRMLWQTAWTLINGRANWDANPWVWVIGFRRVEGADHA